MNTTLQLDRPIKNSIAASVADHWKPGGFIHTRKYDGSFVRGGLAVRNHVLIVEHMKPKSGGKFTASDLAEFALASHAGRKPEFYAAHSIAVLDGQNVLNEPASVRWAQLRRLFANGAQLTPDGVRILLADSGNGGEFFQAVIRDGGEGVCAVASDSPWGTIYAAKPFMEIKALVIGKDFARATLDLADPISFEPLGKVPCRAQFDKVRIGDIVDIEYMSRHSSGALREARFVGFRKETVI